AVGLTHEAMDVERQVVGNRRRVAFVRQLLVVFVVALDNPDRAMRWRRIVHQPREPLYLVDRERKPVALCDTLKPRDDLDGDSLWHGLGSTVGHVLIFPSCRSACSRMRRSSCLISSRRISFTVGRRIRFFLNAPQGDAPISLTIGRRDLPTRLKALPRQEIFITPGFGPWNPPGSTFRPARLLIL